MVRENLKEEKGTLFSSNNLIWSVIFSILLLKRGNVIHCFTFLYWCSEIWVIQTHTQEKNDLSSNNNLSKHHKVSPQQSNLCIAINIDVAITVTAWPLMLQTCNGMNINFTCFYPFLHLNQGCSLIKSKQEFCQQAQSQREHNRTSAEITTASIRFCVCHWKIERRIVWSLSVCRLNSTKCNPFNNSFSNEFFSWTFHLSRTNTKTG